MDKQDTFTVQDVEGVASNMPTRLPPGKEACMLAQLDWWPKVNSSLHIINHPTSLHVLIGWY